TACGCSRGRGTNTSTQLLTTTARSSNCGPRLATRRRTYSCVRCRRIWFRVLRARVCCRCRDCSLACRLNLDPPNEARGMKRSRLGWLAVCGMVALCGCVSTEAELPRVETVRHASWAKYPTRWNNTVSPTPWQSEDVVQASATATETEAANVPAHTID